MSLECDVSGMDKMLMSQYDYQAVDKECKATDYKIYNEFFAQKMSRSEILKHLKISYDGFDEADMQKVLDWAKEAAKL